MKIGINGLEGVVMEIMKKPNKDETKININCLLYQQGERNLIMVRINEEIEKEIEVGSKVSFTGNVLSWKQRDGIGSMLIADGVIV